MFLLCVVVAYVLQKVNCSFCPAVLVEADARYVFQSNEWKMPEAFRKKM